MKVTISPEKGIVRIVADKDNGLSRGYACFKGLQAAEAHHGPQRLLHPSKLQPDGSRTVIPLEQALNEIAARLDSLLTRHGPDSVALFCGNGSLVNSSASPMHRSFLQAIGSRQYFSTLTIDQSAKMISFGRLGGWAGGMFELEDMDVLLIFGSNPLISNSAVGTLCIDPLRRLKAVKEGGLKLIIVDPRKTETAHFADLSVRPFPGQDAAIAAGLIHLILSEGWDNTEFCRRHVGSEGMAKLRATVAPFTPDMVEARAGLASGELRAIAEMFARDGRRGVAYAATGPNMTAYSNLAQHMIELLNVVCGRFPCAGDPVSRTNLQGPRASCVEQVIAPSRPWEVEPPSRIRGAGSLFGERLSGTLADEILTSGKGQIRALIVDGGNPALSLPDQRKAVKALSSLDLLVCIDPWMTPTAKLAHYVLPPLMQYERGDLSMEVNGFDLWPGSWLQYTPAILPPPNPDVVDDWYVYWALAKRLGKPINYAGKGQLPFDETPTTEDLLALKIRDGQITLQDLALHPHGRDLGLELGVVGSAPPNNSARFDVMPADVAEELASFLEQMDQRGRVHRQGKTYPFLMTTRRLRDFFNSTGTELTEIRKRTPYNAAYLNGLEMGGLGIIEGDLIELTSSHGRTTFIAARDDNLRDGVVATTHGWGSLPDANVDLHAAGTCVNLLIDDTDHVETINAMPHFSGVPVDIRPMHPKNKMN
jgi:anaerobic selenocysteine-containing dehydrogenase